MKVVLDTNVLISGIFFGGIPGRIVDAWTNSKFQVYATPQILGEYLRVLDEFFKKNPANGSRFNWTAILPELCHLIPDIKSKRFFSRDPLDDKFVLCAIRTRSSYIVTGDDDLLVLSLVNKTKIISPRKFMEALKI